MYFQPGEDPGRSHLRDCEIFANLRLKLYSTILQIVLYSFPSQQMEYLDISASNVFETLQDSLKTEQKKLLK